MSSRSAGGSAFGGGGPFGGGGFEGEMSPEDLFNMFFGGGGASPFGNGFGGGPGVFQFQLLSVMGAESRCSLHDNVRPRRLPGNSHGRWCSASARRQRSTAISHDATLTSTSSIRLLTVICAAKSVFHTADTRSSLFIYRDGSV